MKLNNNNIYIMIRTIECTSTIIHSLECNIFGMSEAEKIRVLCTILYTNEAFWSLTATQIERVREIIKEFT